MTSRSTRQFFFDLGVLQSFSRPRTPTDNGAAESWMATLKCERLYDADTAQMTPDEVESMIDRFITYYNEVRLHQSLRYVTPVERHEGRHTVIIAARKEGMARARQARLVADRQGSGSTRRANSALRGSQRAVSRPVRGSRVIGAVFMTMEGPGRPMRVGISPTKAVEGSDATRVQADGSTTPCIVVGTLAQPGSMRPDGMVMEARSLADWDRQVRSNLSRQR
jgi:hypothetical protein